jgi:hypothetical protein
MKKRFFYLAFMMFVFAGMFSSCKKSSLDKAVAPVTGTQAAAPVTGTQAPVTAIGTWSGTVFNIAEHNSFSISFTLKQTGNDITGEFSTAAAPGNVTGSLSGNSIVLTITPAASSGYTEVDTFKGTLNTAATEITGTFNSTQPGESGTFDIKKQ